MVINGVEEEHKVDSWRVWPRVEVGREKAERSSESRCQGRSR